MTINDKIRDEKLQFNISREATKISALSCGKIDKYEYLTVEEILFFDQRRLIEQARCTYSSLGKALEKQIKPIEDQEEKQIKVIENREKQPVESDKIVKKDFNVDRESGPLEEQKNI